VLEIRLSRISPSFDERAYPRCDSGLLRLFRTAVLACSRVEGLSWLSSEAIVGLAIGRLPHRIWLDFVLPDRKTAVASDIWPLGIWGPGSIRAEIGPWGAMEQWMQLRFIVRGIGHSAATIWASSTATLFILFAAATGTAFVSTRFGCLQPDCLPAEGAAIQSPQQSLALGQDGI